MTRNHSKVLRVVLLLCYYCILSGALVWYMALLQGGLGDFCVHIFVISTVNMRIILLVDFNHYIVFNLCTTVLYHIMKIIIPPFTFTLIQNQLVLLKLISYCLVVIFLCILFFIFLFSPSRSSYWEATWCPSTIPAVELC